jgi:hypothetical protein
MRGESVESHTRARSLASPGRGEGRTTCAWMVRRNPAPRLAGARLPFSVFGFLMVLNYEISLLSSSANLSDDECSRSGTSRHPLSPSPSLRFPLWAALAVQRWMSMSPKDMWFQMSVDVTRTYLKFIQFKVSIPTAATFITFDGHAIICSPQEVLLSTSCK